MKNVILACVVFTLLFGCGNSGVIYGKDPFFKVEVGMSESRSEEFIERTMQFAERNGLEININRFGNGKFSTLLHNDNINIGARNGVAMGRITIDSIVKNNPTQEDIHLTSAYMSDIRYLLLP